jgi:hypothetical protein
MEKNKKKEYYFDAIVNFINSFKKYNEKDIIKIQSNIRRKNIHNNTNLRGKGYLNRKLCNNEEDFFTYEPKEDIENIYFISYTDKNNFTWCFDVRSFNKLFQFDCKNPYTRENFPDSFILKSKTVTNILKGKNLKLNQKNFKNVNIQSKKLLTLPIHQYLTKTQINFIAQKIKNFYKIYNWSFL